MNIEFEKIDITQAFILPTKLVDELMFSMNGEYLKIYLYFLRNKLKNFSIKDLADEYDILESDITRALRYLSSKGLIKILSDNETLDGEKRDVVVYEENIIQKFENSLNKKEILKDKNDINLFELDDDRNFKLLIQMVGTYLRNNLSQTDIRILAYMYDVLNFPIDVIEYLVETCIENDKKSLRYMEKIAISWHEQGIKTKEEAIKQKLELKNKYRPVLNAIGLYDVQYPTDNQKEFMDKWYDKYAFSLDIICKAAQISIDRKGKIGLFEYTDKILLSWKDSNVRSIDDIEKLELEFKEKQKNKNLLSSKEKVLTVNKFNNFQQRNDDLELKIKNRL